MTPLEILTIVVLCVYAVYRQTIRHEVTGTKRFKLALIYAGVGLLVGGFYMPSSTISWALLGFSVALSTVVGYWRGRLTRMWTENGKVYSQGTRITITLFILLIVVKFALGVAEYFAGTSSHGGFGEVMLLIAIMLAFQAEIVWRRGKRLLVQAAQT